jgi:flagellar hook-associated protein 3 FlgL
MKTSMESVKGLVTKALTATTNSENKVTIANEIESLKNTIYSLSNTKIDGQYLFSGKDSSVETFKKDVTTGKISYASTNDNKTINVENNVYNLQGVNGIELLYYTNQIATIGKDLTFDENEIILDKEGNQYKLVDTNSDDIYDGLYLNGDTSNSTLAITANSDGSFTVNNSTNTTLQSKHSTFDYLDTVINALKQQDSNGYSITQDEATTILSTALDKFENAYDEMNITHAKLGTRTASINNYENIVQTKLTNLKIFQETYSSADLTTLAIESQSLQNTYTALYSTINKINNLSLVNYLN